MSGRATKRGAMLAMLLGACSGSTPPATPVTLIAHNTLAFDIFVPDTYGEGGLAVESLGSLGASASPLVESAPCACEECANACAEANVCANSCEPEGSIHRIPAGTSFTRTFAGTSLAATRADCGVGDLGPVCYESAGPVASGTYELELCYATDTDVTSASQTLIDGGPVIDFIGTLSGGTLVCVTKQFSYPADHEVEIEPAEPPACSSSGSCPAGQYCQKGICSANCLASGVPTLGASWSTAVTLVSDEGLFTSTDAGSGILRRTATATVGSASYDGDDLDLIVTSHVGVGVAEAHLQISLAPGTPVVPLNPGETVSLLVVTNSPINTPIEMVQASAAGTIRDANNNLLLAADEGLGGLLLQVSDLAPFTLNFDGDIFGCDTSMLCGKLLYRETTFSDGTASATVEAGQMGTLAGPGGTYAATAVADYTYLTGTVADCGPEPINSFNLVLQDRQL